MIFHENINAMSKKVTPENNLNIIDYLQLDVIVDQQLICHCRHPKYLVIFFRNHPNIAKYCNCNASQPKERNTSARGGEEGSWEIAERSGSGADGLEIDCHWHEIYLWTLTLTNTSYYFTWQWQSWIQTEQTTTNYSSSIALVSRQIFKLGKNKMVN